MALTIYNVPEYNTALYYGSVDDNADLLWTFIVDWRGDNTWGDGHNEAKAMIGLHISRGRDHMVKPNGQGWERYAPGKATITLDNEDGRYDPYNTSSPLYPHVTPGKFVIIRARNGSNNYNVMHGIILDIQPYNKSRRRFVHVTITDALGWLSDKIVDIYGLHQNLKWEGISNGIRDRVGFPDDKWPQSTVDTGQYTIPYSWYSEINALEAMGQLADTEMGGFVHDRFGNLLHFAADSTYLGTVTVDEGEILADISIPQPWEVVRNDIRVFVYPYQLFSVNTTIWDMNEKPTVDYNQKITILAKFRYDGKEVCGSGVQFNLRLSAAEDGTGIQSTNYTLEYGDIGDAVLFSVLNNESTLPTAYILESNVLNSGPMFITGDVIYNPYRRTVYASDAASQALYGARSLTIDTPWIQDLKYAQAYANHVLSQLKDPKKQPTIRIENRPSLQFARDIWRDKITLNAATLGISGEEFRIGKVEHEWLRENGQAVRTTWKLEPYLTPFEYP